VSACNGVNKPLAEWWNLPFRQHVTNAVVHKNLVRDGGDIHAEIASVAIIGAD
jgi:hypothetical protein